MIVPLFYNAGTSKSVINQINWQKDRLPFVWGKIVENKISSQKQLLLLLKRDFEFSETVLPNDSTNVEGRFAGLYFCLLFGGSFKRHLDDNVNVLLNYGFDKLY